MLILFISHNDHHTKTPYGRITCHLVTFLGHAATHLGFHSVGVGNLLCDFQSGLITSLHVLGEGFFFVKSL